MTKRLPRAEALLGAGAKSKGINLLCCLALMLGNANVACAFSGPSSLETAIDWLQAPWNQTSSRNDSPKAFSSWTYIHFNEGDFDNTTDFLLEGAVYLEVAGAFRNKGKFGGKGGTTIQAQTVHNTGTQIGSEGETWIKAEELSNSGNVAESLRPLLIGDQVHLSVQKLENNIGKIGGRSGTNIQAKTISNVAATLGEGGLTSLIVEESLQNLLGTYQEKPHEMGLVIGDRVEISAGAFSNINSAVGGQTGTKIKAKTMTNKGSQIGVGGETSLQVVEELINHSAWKGDQREAGLITGDTVHLSTNKLDNHTATLGGQSGTDIQAQTIRNRGATLGEGGTTSVKAEKSFENSLVSDKTYGDRSSAILGDKVELFAEELTNRLSLIGGKTETKVEVTSLTNSGGKIGEGGTTFLKVQKDFGNKAEASIADGPNSSAVVGDQVEISAQEVTNIHSLVGGKAKTKIDGQKLLNRGGKIGEAGETSITVDDLENNSYVEGDKRLDGLITGETVKVKVKKLDNIVATVGGLSGTSIEGQKVFNLSGQIGKGGLTSVKAEKSLENKKGYNATYGDRHSAILGEKVEVSAQEVTNIHSLVGGKAKTKIDGQKLLNRGGKIGEAGETSITVDDLENNSYVEGDKRLDGLITGETVKVKVKKLDNIVATVGGLSGTSIEGQKVFNLSGQIGKGGLTSVKAEKSLENKKGYNATYGDRHSAILGEKVEISAQEVTNIHSLVGGKAKTKIDGQKLLNRGGKIGEAGETSITVDDLENNSYVEGDKRLDGLITGETVKVKVKKLDNNVGVVGGLSGTSVEGQNVFNLSGQIGGGGLTSVKAEKSLENKKGYNATYGDRHSAILGEKVEISAQEVTNIHSLVGGKAKTKIDGQKLLNRGGKIGEAGETSITVDDLENNSYVEGDKRFDGLITGETVKVKVKKLDNIVATVGGLSGTSIEGQKVFNLSGQIGKGGLTSVKAEKSLENKKGYNATYGDRHSAILGEKVEVSAQQLTNIQSLVGGKAKTKIDGQKLLNRGGKIGEAGETSITVDDLENNSYVEGDKRLDGLITGETVKVKVKKLDNNVGVVGGLSGTSVEGQNVFNLSGQIGGGGLTSVKAEKSLDNKKGYNATYGDRHSAILGEKVEVSAQEVTNIQSLVGGKAKTKIDGQKLLNQGGKIGEAGETSITVDDLENNSYVEGDKRLDGLITGETVKVKVKKLDNNVGVVGGLSGTSVEGQNVFNLSGQIGGGGLTSVKAEKSLENKKGYHATYGDRHSAILGEKVEVSAQQLTNIQSLVGGKTKTKVEVTTVTNKGGEIGIGGQTILRGTELENYPASDEGKRIGGLITGEQVNISEENIENDASTLGGFSGTDLQAEGVSNIGGQIGRGGKTSLTVGNFLHNIQGSHETYGKSSAVIIGDEVKISAKGLNNWLGVVEGKNGTRVDVQILENHGGKIGDNGPTSLRARDLVNQHDMMTGKRLPGQITGETLQISANHLENKLAVLNGRYGTKIETQTFSNIAGDIGAGGKTFLSAKKSLENLNAYDAIHGNRRSSVTGHQVEVFTDHLTNRLSFMGGEAGTKISAQDLNNDGGKIGKGGETLIRTTNLLNHSQGMEGKLIEGQITGETLQVFSNSLDNTRAFLGGQAGTDIHAQSAINKGGTIGGGGTTSLTVEDSLENVKDHDKVHGDRIGAIIGDQVQASTNHLTNRQSLLGGKAGTKIDATILKNQAGQIGVGGDTIVKAEELSNHALVEEGTFLPALLTGYHVNVSAIRVDNQGSHLGGQAGTDIDAQTIRNIGANIGTGGTTSVQATTSLHNLPGQHANDSLHPSRVRGDKVHVSTPQLSNQASLIGGHQGTEIEGGNLVNDRGKIGDGGPSSITVNTVANIGGVIQGGTSLDISARQNILSQSTLTLNENQSQEGHRTSSSKTITLDQKAQILVTEATPEGALKVKAQGDVTLMGSKVRNAGSGETKVEAGNNLMAHSLQTGQESTSSSTPGRGKTETSQEVHTQSHPTTIEGQGPLHLEAGGQAKFTNARLQGTEVEVKANQGIDFAADKITDLSHTHSYRKGWIWNTSKDSGYHREKVEPTQIISSGPVQASSPQGIKVDIPSYRPMDSGVARAIQGQSGVDYNSISETYKDLSDRRTSLTPVAVALLSIGLNLFTPAVGQAFAGTLFTAGTIPFAMTAAGTKTLLTSAGLHFVGNQGDLGKTLDGLTNVNTWKGVGASMLTAGLSQGATNLLTPPSPMVTRVDPVFSAGEKGIVQSGVTTSASMPHIPTFMDRLPGHVIGGVSSIAAQGLVYGGDPKVILTATATAVANVVGTEASIPLGKAYNAGMMGEIPHKVSHGIVGCVTGAMANFATDSAETSCISGAAGQVAGEMAGQAYLKAQFPSVEEQKNIALGIGPTPAKLIEQTTNVARLAGGVAAALVGGDPNIGAQTAAVAAENNVVQFLPLMITAGVTALGGIYATIEGGGNPLKGFERIDEGEDSLSQTQEKIVEEIANTSFGKKMASKGADVIQVAYETFPEEIDRINKGVERVNKGLGIAITYLDTATGHTISDFWNNLSPDTQKQLRGAGKLGAKLSPLAWGGKVATTFVFSKDPVKLANSLQAAKNAKLARTAQKGEGGDLKRTEPLSAGEANRRYLEKKPDDRPPYAEATRAREFVLDKDRTFVRVHQEGRAPSEWIMRSEEFSALKSESVQSKVPLEQLLKDRFALPKEPTHISEVHVPAGTKIRVGTTAPQEGWGKGGGIQYEMGNKLGDELYKNQMPISEYIKSTEVKP